MGAVENQRQVYHRSHRPWKSLQDFHTPTAQRLLINKTKQKPAEVSPINRRPVCLSLGGHRSLSPPLCHRLFLSVTAFSCLSPPFHLVTAFSPPLRVSSWSVESLILGLSG